MCADIRNLRGLRVALAGRFASVTRAQLTALIRQSGGVVDREPGPRTRMLVLGQTAESLGGGGRAAGTAATSAVEVLDEEEFLARFGLIDQRRSIHRRYTLGQLVRILGISPARMRAWIRLGLVEPVEVVQDVALFSYAQLCLVRSLWRLARTGLRPLHLRQTLERLGRHISAGPRRPSGSLVDGPGRRVLGRRPDGRLADAGGQLYFDFLAAEQGTCILPLDRLCAGEDWFDRAVALEDAGRLAEALAAYGEAARFADGDPVLHFNMGNVHAALGEPEAAAREFRHAVALDPTCAEAWNNLGIVLSESGEAEAALDALKRAVHLLPTFADAHFNLAQTLQELGRSADARRHWSAYLRHDADSPWADHARAQLFASPAKECPPG